MCYFNHIIIKALYPHFLIEDNFTLKSSSQLAYNIQHLDYIHFLSIAKRESKIKLFDLYFSQRTQYMDTFKIRPNYISRNLFRMYCRLSNVTSTLRSFIHIVKHRYCKVFNKTNLLMEPLKKEHIRIIEDNRIYCFDFYEIIKIIKTNLLYHEDYFIMPNDPINPYTNITFSKYNVYNIFFKLKKSDYSINKFLLFYVKSNCCKYKFKKKYKEIIQNDILDYEYSKLRFIKKRILFLEVTDKYDIEEFLNAPHSLLIKLFDNSIIKPFFKAKYTCSLTYKKNYNKKLYLFIKNFREDNPLFGRRIYYKDINTNTYKSYINTNVVF